MIIKFSKALRFSKLHGHLQKNGEPLTERIDLAKRHVPKMEMYSMHPGILQYPRNERGIDLRYEPQRDLTYVAQKISVNQLNQKSGNALLQIRLEQLVQYLPEGSGDGLMKDIILTPHKQNNYELLVRPEITSILGYIKQADNKKSVQSNREMIIRNTIRTILGEKYSIVDNIITRSSTPEDLVPEYNKNIPLITKSESICDSDDIEPSDTNNSSKNSSSAEVNLEDTVNVKYNPSLDFTHDKELNQIDYTNQVEIGSSETDVHKTHIKEKLNGGKHNDITQEALNSALLCKRYSFLKRKRFSSGLLSVLLQALETSKSSEVDHYIKQFKYSMKSQNNSNETPIAIIGTKGSGKSHALSTIVIAARSNGWLVIYEPNMHQYLTSVTPIDRSAAGLYVQKDLAVKFLQRLLTAHQTEFEKIPLNKDIMGNITLDGSSVKEYLYDVFVPMIEEVVSHEEKSRVKNSSYIDNIKHDRAQARKKIARVVKIREDIKFPSLVTEIIESHQSNFMLSDLIRLGIEKEGFSTQVIAELFNQVRNQKLIPVLICIENTNLLAKRSEYLSLRFRDTITKGRIPGRDLAIPHLLYNQIHSKYPQGRVIFTSRTPSDKAAEYYDMPYGEKIVLPNFSLAQVREIARSWVTRNAAEPMTESNIQEIYGLSGGNGEKLRHSLAKYY